MESIPFIDGQALRSGAGNVREEFCEALHRVGFCYLENHGVDLELQSRLVELARAFFAEPQSAKEEIAMARGGLAWRGYFPVGRELTSGKPDQKEGIYFGVEHGVDHPAVQSGLPLHGKNQWPRGVGFEAMPELVTTYLEQMRGLGESLMGALALGLGLEAGKLVDRFSKDPTLLFRFFNYPRHEWDATQDEWGVREHTDMGFLTLLLQDDQGGLEVKASNGDWVAVPPKDGTFVVNIGDMLEVWTHGIFRATPHRVRNQGERDRLSMPFFYDPSWSAPLKPIELSLIAPQWAEKRRPLDSHRWDGRDLSRVTSQTYGEYVWDKVKSVFPSLSPSAQNHGTEPRG